MTLPKGQEDPPKGKPSSSKQDATEIIKNSLSGAIGALLTTGIIAISTYVFSEVKNIGTTIEKVDKNETQIQILKERIGDIKFHTESVSRKVEPKQTYRIPFKWNFSTKNTPRAAYIGNINQIDAKGPGGFAELVLTLAEINENGGWLWIHNPVTEAKEVQFKVKIIVVY